MKNSASDSRLEARAREHELKVITDRITLVEKHFVALSKDVLSYNTALEGLRDKGSRISMSLEAYAEQEFPSVRNSAQSIAECIASVQDYVGAEVNFLHDKVAQPLSLYSTNCKHARDYTKETTTFRDKELAKLKVLDKMKTKEPANRSKLLEQELQKASVDSTRSRQTMVERMVNFEKKKIEDFKKTFGDFFHGQLLFHAKALEIYTQAYRSIMAIEEGQDLEAFENLVHPNTIPPRLDSTGGKTGSQTSLQYYGSQGSLMGSQQSLNRTTQSLQSQGSM